ncbi:MAG: LamG domain-containing protein, partial [Caldilinea sp.]|nr:LamG domain-containing protein [Caldilinea sp.]MDW8439105.1 LamG domain-containing protein [Caldilineaceae bacterium]
IVSQADETRGWAMELNGGRPTLWVYTSRGWEAARHSTRLSAGVWHHVAATYNNGVARVFVNGQPGSATTLRSGLTAASQLRFGGVPGYAYFAGRLDDVRISQSVRYVSSFTPLAVLSAPDANTLGQWEFNEGGGQQAADRASASNSGQLGLSAEVDAADPAWVIAGR